ncbi:MAG: aminotransferase class III-fold pyridoxal phosphate-dependent enzyme [Spirochaetes bacterium]|nr:aminotransferase class III-fold pyridoxal phosphate-dependent enzyme [Spirochaetota bacterium]
MNTLQSHYLKAKEVLPGGVNSSTRFNKAIGKPFYVSKGRGSRVWDIEGKEYIDMCCAHGAGLLGNAHPAIDGALRRAASIGYVNSFETEYHEELARRVCGYIPCADRVRFCSSGSEATLHLIRACRAFTGKEKIIRIEGHFHGYHEMIYIGGQPPRSEFGRNRSEPYIESPGIPKEYAQFIIPVPYNDREALAAAVNDHAHETAMLIMEPVNFNCAGITPEPGYLAFVRELTRDNDIVLFFDEIQSSFKKSLGGAQADFGVIPDVCTIGKALGGGLPLSAFCGRAEIMDIFQPVGPVQHSGTFNAHLVPVLAGLAFLDEAARPDFYPSLRSLEDRFHAGIDAIIHDYGLSMTVTHHGARFNMLLGRTEPALRYEDTFCHDSRLFLEILKSCWERGVYFHDYGGGPAHHGYSIKHTNDDIDRVLTVLHDVLYIYQNSLQMHAEAMEVL